MRPRGALWRLPAVLLLALLGWQMAAFADPTPAGTRIENQARAYFVDENNNNVELYSNVVRAVVQAVEGLSLLDNPVFSGIPGAANQCVPQRLTNTGNVAVDVNLLLDADNGDFAFANPRIIEDLNRNGLVDPNEPEITNPPTPSRSNLLPGDSIELLLCGDVPAGTGGQTGELDLQVTTVATPEAPGGLVVTSDDAMLITTGAALDVNKFASTLSPNPGEGVIFTIQVRNLNSTDLNTITAVVDGASTQLVVLRDEIPAKMTFSGLPDTPAAAGGTVLFHISGAATHTYTVNQPTDLSTVDAIAVGYAPQIGNAFSFTTLQFRFTAAVNTGVDGFIENVAEVHFNDGSSDRLQESNRTLLKVPEFVGQRIEGVVFGVAQVGTTFSDTGELANLRVRLIDVEGLSDEGTGRTDCGQSAGDIACVFNADGSIAESTVTTGSDGAFLFPLVAPGTYRVEVLPEQTVTATFATGFPSDIAPVNLPSFRRVNPGASYGSNFVLDRAGIFIFDIPITRQAINATPILIDKTADRQRATIGDIVQYTIKIENSNDSEVTDVIISDTLPVGFAYVPNSAQLVSGTGTATAAIQPGGSLQINLGTLPPTDGSSGAGNDYREVTYRLRIGPGALQGKGLNTAVVGGNLGGAALPPTSDSVRVNVDPGVFSDRGFILGKVYNECSFNRTQDHEEIGIPGVRIYLQDGTFAITDAEGKYSFAGLRPQTYVVKVDPITMPIGFEMKELSVRNAGDAQSRFVDLKSGELHKADFAQSNCSEPLMEQVRQRREQGGVYRAEVETVLQRDLQLEDRPVTRQLQSLAASGVQQGQEDIAYAGLTRNPIVRDPNISDPSGFGGIALRPTSVGSGASVDLEELLPTLTNEFGFVDLKDGDVMPASIVNIRIKGPTQTEFQLFVNDDLVSGSRVGQKSTLDSAQIQAWEFVSMKMRPGQNDLEALMVDQFGNEREKQMITVTVPAAAAFIRLTVPKEPVADGITPAVIGVDLVDAQGVPVTARTPVLLESSDGVWQVDDIDPSAPGLQTYIENGRADFLLLGPQDPGEVIVRAATGTIISEAEIDFVPELRPMVAAGLIEGEVSLRDKVVATLDNDPFERELSEWSETADNGKIQAGARAAFFLKGKILGKYLLTASYDNEKPQDERLFRDIQPDKFYPVYGDSSVKGFEAQSTSDLYVRVDGQRSFALYGDYTTPTASSILGLSRFSRSLTGGVSHYENDLVEVNVFGSYESDERRIENIDPRGLSGPYQIPNFSGDAFIENSEQIEIVVFNGNTPGVIKEVRPQTRFTDYQLNPQTGVIFFRAPVTQFQVEAGVNHPQQIRVIYESRSGGPEYWTYGGDATLKIGQVLALSGSYAKEDDDLTPNSIMGAGAEVKVGPNTGLYFEYAYSETEDKDPSTPETGSKTGGAARVELRHTGEKVQATVYGARSDANFDNASGSVQAGREEAGVQVGVKLWPSARGSAEAIYDKDRVTGKERRGAAAAIEQSIGSLLRVEVGVRHAEGDAESVQTTVSGVSTGEGANRKIEATSVRGRVTVRVPSSLPVVGDAEVFTEYETDLDDNSKRLWTIGGALGLGQVFNDRVELYVKHEAISSLDNRFGLNSKDRRNATLAGLRINYLENSSVFTEYRIRDAISGREAEAAIGLDNQFYITEGLALNTSLERIETLESGGGGSPDSLAVALGLSYTGSELWKGTARFEFRTDDSSREYLNTLGVGRELSRSWVFLGRNTLSINEDKSSRKTDIRDRLQLGFAYRDTDFNRWQALFRYELEYDDSQQSGTDNIAHLMSANVHYQPTGGLALTGRYAVRWFDYTDSTGTSDDYLVQLASGRLTYDITERWDIGLIGQALHSEDGTSYGVGAEIGYLLWSNLWASLGYNFYGLAYDKARGLSDLTNQGPYFKIRYKFDERLFSGNDPLVNNTKARFSEEKMREIEARYRLESQGSDGPTTNIQGESNYVPDLPR